MLLLLLAYMSACEKEYSYEGGGNPPPVIPLPADTSQPVGTNPPDPGALPGCVACAGIADIPESSWSFKTGNSFLCGEVDTAIMLSLDRNTFTFFGPSACGRDTGLIFTVSLSPNTLDSPGGSISASSAIFYYYHTNQPYILVGHADQPFNLLIISYDHTTKQLTGTFSGTGFRQDGRAVNITEGKFKFKLI